MRSKTIVPRQRLLLVCITAVAFALLVFLESVRRTNSITTADANGCVLQHIQAPTNSGSDLDSAVSVRSRAHVEQASFCNLLAQLTFAEHLVVPEIQFEGGVPYSLYVYNAGNTVSSDIIATKVWEAEGTRQALWALKLVETMRGKDRAGFLDIGANIGWWSLAVAAHDYKVAAVEASPRNQAIFRHSLCDMDSKLAVNVDLYAMGVGSEEDVCEVLVHRGNTGNAMLRCQKTIAPTETRLFGSSEPHPVPGAGRDVMFDYQATVRINTLDQLFGNNGGNLQIGAFGVMKLDVEGLEPAVVLGGDKEFFANGNGPPLVLMEFNRYMLSTAGRDPADILKMWAKHGYSISLEVFFPEAPAFTEDKVTTAAVFSKFGKSKFVDPVQLDEWARDTPFKDVFVIHNDFLKHVHNQQF
ncbi:hypothetical protein HDU87_001473 [Geranomyces variabilis]|uniref:Methyltransferase FkbM domain-containing protein n=1 Tax=Geranomyces variabilis TaxID=109894 RepID=A0AAD5TGQ8_9FUNG|nr:hypothetical protein HDU87_001473 [Geranomyces variabilis]